MVNATDVIEPSPLDEIHEIGSMQANQIIETYLPIGKYFVPDTLTAIDNSTGDAWTEAFTRREDAIAWLNGEFEVSDRPDVLYKPSTQACRKEE